MGALLHFILSKGVIIMSQYSDLTSVTNLEIFSYYILSQDKKSVFKNYVLIINGNLFNIQFRNVNNLSFNDKLHLRSIPNVEYNSLAIYLHRKGNFIIESFADFCKRVGYEPKTYGKEK